MKNTVVPKTSRNRLHRQQEAFTSEGSPAPGMVQANHPATQPPLEEPCPTAHAKAPSMLVDSTPWGPQAQQTLLHVPFSGERMPWPLIQAMALVKRTAARVNASLGMLDAPEADAIVRAADEVLAGTHPMAFPVSLWQAGSATQAHIDMNEMLARRANQLLGGASEALARVDLHDHVNLGQSTDDVVPTAMNLAVLITCRDDLLPALVALRRTLDANVLALGDIVATGRTGLQDTAPPTLGQEISGWAAQLEQAGVGLLRQIEPLHELAIGSTAMGTGLNTHPAFADHMVRALTDITGLPLRRAGSAFAAQAGHDALVAAHGALRTLAVALMKVANGLRWLSSGPRCGPGEWIRPASEPVSSSMPGKAIAPECEALLMVATQVMGNDVAVGIAAAAGPLPRNTARPLLVHNLLQSICLLSNGMAVFSDRAVGRQRPVGLFGFVEAEAVAEGEPE